ncbi:hypothetical protein BGX31_003134, partial [Mortierella sp. GBA43]
MSSYLLSTSFQYQPEVVDLDAMNITEMFPEANSLSFDMSANYSHSYSDSVSGIPLAQRDLWDEGSLSMPQTVNSSRVFQTGTGPSSLSNSANNSVNYGQQQSSRLLSVPQQHYGRHGGGHGTRLKVHQEMSEEGTTSGGNTSHSFDDFDESSLHNGWVDETKDHNESDLSCDLMKEELNADDTRDHSRQELDGSGLAGAGQVNPNMMAGNGLNDPAGGRPKNEIFNQEFRAALNAPFIMTTPPPPLSKNRNLLEGLHVVPTVTDTSLTEEQIRNMVRKSHQAKQQQLEQEKERQEAAAAPPKQKTEEEKAKDREAFQVARKSFMDSLKMGDPIKTPHKFAPKPLPILWNDPRIRAKGLPTFQLSDYIEKPKPVVSPIKINKTNKLLESINNLTNGTAPANVNGALPPRPPTALSSSPSLTLYSSSPTPTLPVLSAQQPVATTTTTTITTTITTTTTAPSAAEAAAAANKSDSILGSMHPFATPPASAAAMDSMSQMLSPKAPAAATTTTTTGFVVKSPDTPQPAQQLQQQQQHLQFQQQLLKEQQEHQEQQEKGEKQAEKSMDKDRPAEKRQDLSPPTDRPRRPSSIQNPHLLFDPTITPEERAAADTKSGKNTLERRSALQQAVRAKMLADGELSENGEDVGGVSGSGSVRRGSLRNNSRKRRSLIPDLFIQEQPQDNGKEGAFENGHDLDDARSQHSDESRSRRGSRPLSANILPESLTSYNNHALFKDGDLKLARERRLSQQPLDKERRIGEDDEGTSPTTPGSAANTSPTSLRLPGTLSLGRAAGTRYGRSGSGSSVNSNGTQQQQISPTTPTSAAAASPYGTLTGRAPPRPQQPVTHRSSLSGGGGMNTPGSRTSQQLQYHQHKSSMDDVDAPKSAAGATAEDDRDHDRERDAPLTPGKWSSSPPSTLTRSDSKLLSPTQRRSGLIAPSSAAGAGAQDKEMDLPKSARLSFSSSPPTERERERERERDRYDEYYRPESREDYHVPQQPSSTRNSFVRQRGASGDRDREVPEYRSDDDAEERHYQQQQRQLHPPHRRYASQTMSQRSSLREPGMALRRTSSELHKEIADAALSAAGARSPQQARLRSQDYRYGHGYGDYDMDYDDDYPNPKAGYSIGAGGVGRRTSNSSVGSSLTVRHSPVASPLKDVTDYFSPAPRSSGSGGLTSPPVPLPSGSRFADHHRRPSRTSPPPLSGNPNRLSSSSLAGVSGIVGPGGSTVTPRRSLSNVGGGSGILPPPIATGSRRLSNTGSSHGGYSHSRSGSSSSISGIMAPVGIHNHANGGIGGGVSNIAGPRSSIYNSGSGAYGSASDRRNMSISESNVPYHTPAPLSPPRQRGSGSSSSSEPRTRTS